MGVAFSTSPATSPATRPRSKDFSLAAACFDFPCADDCASPAQHAPDSWRAELLQKADAAVWSGLFTACRTGRDLVLSTAPHATLTLDFTAQQPSSMQQQLSAVRHCLSVRGTLKTSLIVICELRVPGSAEAVSAIPAAISGVGAGIVSITVRNEDARPADTNAEAEAFLQALCAVCPNLRSLDVSAFPYPLPPPSALPRLTQLTVKQSWLVGFEETRLLDSIVPLLPQLRQASSRGWIDDIEGDALEALFTQSAPAPHLTHLSMDVWLTESLCHAIKRCAPALTHIECWWVRCITEQEHGWEWGVRSLTVDEQDIGDLIALPVNPTNKVDFAAEKMTLDVKDTDGLPPDLVRRLPEWRFTVRGTIVLSASGFSHHPTALRNTLRQLSALDAPGSTVWLREWDWGVQGMAQVVRDVVPTLPHLRLSVDVGKALTDELLGVALEMGPCVRSLSVEGLELQSDQHANTAWPWDELECEFMTLSSVLKLPRAHGPGDCVIRTLEVYIDTPATEESLHELQGRLQHITWAQRAYSQYVDTKNITFYVQCAEGADPVQQLTSQLALLRAVRLHNTVEASSAQVVLQGWRWCLSGLQALRGLPAWDIVLILKECKLVCGSHSASRVTHELAQCIPTSYSTWVLPEKPGSEALEGVCDGLDSRRAGLGLPRLRIELVGYCEEEVTVGEHVVLSEFTTPYNLFD